MATNFNSIQKFSQSLLMVRDYLNQTGNKKLLGALYNPELRAYSQDLQKNYLGYQEGNSIFLSNDILQNQSPEKVASVFLHELTHFEKQSKQNSLQEERESKTIEENFLDSKGMGKYDNTIQEQLIDVMVRKLYAGLPENT